MPREKQKNWDAMNCITISPRHVLSDDMISAYRGCEAETIQNLKMEFAELTKFSSVLITQNLW